MKILRSEFARNATTLAMGTTFAQAIPIAISPILTRLYSPEDFGILSIFMAATAVCGAVANGKYEMAIMLPKSDREAVNVVFLSVFVAGFFSLILLLAVVFFKARLAMLLGEVSIENWLFVLPLSVFLIGMYNALNYYNSRCKNFKSISTSAIYKSGSSSATQLGLGLAGASAFGLVIGQLVSYFSGNYILLKEVIVRHTLKDVFCLRTIKELMIRYKKFPLFTLPGNLLNTATLNIVSFLVTAIYSTSLLGFYALVNRVLGLPSAVIGRSISQVYFQKVSSARNNEGDVLKVFMTTLNTLVLFAAPIFAFAYFTIEPVFAFVFGEEWSIAGYYGRILIPAIACRFIVSALSPTLNALERQSLIVVNNLTMFLGVIAVFYYGYFNAWKFEQTLILFASLIVLLNCSFLLIYFYCCKSVTNPR